MVENGDKEVSDGVMSRALTEKGALYQLGIKQKDQQAGTGCCSLQWSATDSSSVSECGT